MRLDLPRFGWILSVLTPFCPGAIVDGRLVYAPSGPRSHPSGGHGCNPVFAEHTEGADVELFGGEKGGAVQTMTVSSVSGWWPSSSFSQ